MTDPFILKQAKLELCRRDLLEFTLATKDDYIVNWHHRLLADLITRFVKSTKENPIMYPGTDRPFKDKLMIFEPPQTGKFLPANTLVFTTNGFKKHGYLKVGDYVFGQDGKPKKVLSNSGIYEWNVNEVVFNDKHSLWAAPEHLWKLQMDYGNTIPRVEEIKQTDEIFNRWQHRSPYIDCPPALEMEEKKLPIDPYVLGCWLGDGTSRYGALTVGGQDIAHFSKLGRITEVKPNIFRVNIEGLTTKLRLNNLILNKHIPKKYLLASKQQREQLLQGLMDTDGTIGRYNECEFTQMKGKLAEDTYLLLRTLGYKARKRYSDAKIYGRVVGRRVRIFFVADENDKIFQLKRKADRQKTNPRKQNNTKKKFFIRKVVGEKIVKGNCIQVEGGMYLAGRHLVPTHNSELVSRRVPAWVLGINNSFKVGLCCYSATKAEEFSADIQRIMDTKEYIEIFPGTRLPDSFLRDTPRKKKRTNDYFELYGEGNSNAMGFLKAVGIRGPLTGTALDLAIIDDPIKDDIEAGSERNRESNWNWWLKVLETRLHNDSKILFTMTRWHHDDLAGRILDAEKDDWDVIVLPAIKENNSEPLDPRNIGDALWEDRHSKERMLSVQKRSPRTFISLYQQRPTPEEGSIIHSSWFTEIQDSELPDNMIWDMWIDGAYTKKTENDPTGFLVTSYKMKKIYIKYFYGVYMEMPELLRYVPRLAEEMGLTRRSMIYVEPKASGKTLVQLLRDRTTLNVREIFGRAISMDKTERVKSCAPTVEGGRVFIVAGPWTEPFYDEVTMFPQGKHDEAPDLLAYAIHRYYVTKRGRGLKIRN